jgi:16S rRNA processing protein RimM
VILGKVSGAYGVLGWLRIRPFGDNPERWRSITRWQFSSDENDEAAWRSFTLAECRTEAGQKGGWLARFQEIDTRDAAEKLKGCLVAAARADLPATDNDEFYWGDLLNMTVVTLAGATLGSVAALLETGAHDVLRVTNAEGQEWLIPFVSPIVCDVDMDARRIRVDWGLDWN